MQVRTAGATVAAALFLAGMGVASASDNGVGTGASTADYVAGRILVRYADSVDPAAARALEAANDASRVRQIADLDVTELSVPAGTEQRVVDALLRSGKATFAERDATGHVDATPDDPYLPQQWGVSKVNAPTAWDTTTGRATTVIAVLDTGVNADHPDLTGRLVAGYDFVNADADPADDNGHGTQTAGVAGAAANNATGIAGLCWSCALMPVKVADASGSVSWSNLASGITWATDHGASVISMSLSGSSSSTTLANAVAYAHDHGVVLVAAAGNNGSSTVTYPAGYQQVISVAGTTSSDTLYSWSNYGSWVKVAAPGCDYTTALSGGFGSFCGTSAATPVVAGVVALLRSAQAAASATQIEDALESAAAPVGSIVATGRVDAAASLVALGAAAPAATPSPSASPSASPSSSPAPTASPSPLASPSPTPSAATSPSPVATVQTTQYTGSLNNKTRAVGYDVVSAGGSLQATLSSNKSTLLTLALVDASGRALNSTSGTGTLSVSEVVTAGSYALRVTGDGTRTSFTLAVTS